MASFNQGRFALYLGDGQYVAALSHVCSAGGVATWPVVQVCRSAAEAMTFARSRAIEACHQARRAGLSVWITQAPSAGMAA